MTEQPEYYVDPELDMEVLKKGQEERTLARSDTNDIDDEDNERVNQALYGGNDGMEDECSS